MIRDRIEALVREWAVYSGHKFFEPQAAGLREAADRLSQILAEEEGGWRPIETAPQDGTLIMLCVAGFEPALGKWHLNRWWSVDPVGHFSSDELMNEYMAETLYEPTHWQPCLPGARP